MLHDVVIDTSVKSLPFLVGNLQTYILEFKSSLWTASIRLWRHDHYQWPASSDESLERQMDNYRVHESGRRTPEFTSFA